MRSFHANIIDGEESKCESLGFTDAEVCFFPPILPPTFAFSTFINFSHAFSLAKFKNVCVHNFRH